MKKPKVLFVCTHNSARSQMAEGILNRLYGEVYEVCSAGTKPSSIKPLAVEVMHEIGIDISHHRSKSIDELGGIDFDVAVIVCDQARKACPFIPNTKMTIHRSFEDPVDPASFRKIRDEIREWIEETFKDPSTFDHAGMNL